MTRRLLLVFVSVIAFSACTTKVIRDPHAEPPAVPGDPVVSEAVPFDEAGPPMREGPIEFEGTCIDYSAARDVDRAQTEHRRWLQERAAADRGWTRLTEFAEVFIEDHNDPQEAEAQTHGVDIARLRKDRFIDTDGNHWLFVTTADPCHGFDAPIYIDADDNVFIVAPTVTCATEHTYAACGSWPADGCGTDPGGFSRMYAKVPRGARLLDGYVELKLAAAECYRFDPVEGFSYPP